MTEEELKADIKTIFSKVNDLAINMAVMSEVVPRIEAALRCLPCKGHDDRLKEVEEKAYAVESIWVFIVGGVGIGAGIMSIIMGFIR